MRRFKIGFTLAEVLITLGVIGVVAAITMPTLINNFQVSSWENSLKKSYSTITNGFHALAAEYDGDLRNSGLFDDIDDTEFSERIDNAVKKHFNVVKTCKIGENSTCSKHTVKFLKGVGKASFETEYSRERSFLFDSSLRYVMFLADGSIVSISNNKCTPATKIEESVYKYKCADISIDTNGKNNPNVLGKDAFKLGNLDEKGNLYPDASLEYVKFVSGNINPAASPGYWRNNPLQCGVADIKLKNDTTENIIGQNCVSRIMENGWEMDYLR